MTGEFEPGWTSPDGRWRLKSPPEHGWEEVPPPPLEEAQIIELPVREEPEEAA